MDKHDTPYGIDWSSTATQPMSDARPTRAVLQETVYGWLKGTTVFITVSEFSNLTYADFAKHIGCDAQEYRYKSLGSQRVFTWIAADDPLAKFGAFFRENDDGEWTIWATGSANIPMPDGFIDSLKPQPETKE